MLFKMAAEVCLALGMPYDHDNPLHLMTATTAAVMERMNDSRLMTTPDGQKVLLLNSTAARNATVDSASFGSGDPMLDNIKFYLAGVVDPIFCVFGLIGNIFNAVVLSRRRMKAAMDCTMEQTAYTGLLALAVSDVLYCASGLVNGLLGRSQTVFHDRNLWLYIKIYGPYLKNTFLHTGTWLTVIMAAGRYAAICRPIQARYLLGVNCTRVAVIVTFVVWTLLELPVIWTYQIIEIDCSPAGSVFILDEGPFVVNDQLKMAFTYVWAMLGCLLPVVLLAYCNFHLIRALRESYHMRKLYRVSAKVKSSGSRVTSTLVAIVCMLLVFITPAELLQFYYYAVGEDKVEIVTTAIVATNVLQTMNFAFNFVLYCIVNVQFRETWKDLIYCRACRSRGDSSQFQGRQGQSCRGSLETPAIVTNRFPVKKQSTLKTSL